MRHASKIALAAAIVAASMSLGVSARAAAVPTTEATGFAVLAGHGSFEVTGITVNLTAAVARLPGGRVKGFFRTFSPGFGGFAVRATCMRVEAGRALVGGTIVESIVPSQVGTPGALIVDDRAPGAPPFDRVSLGIGPTADQCLFSPAQVAGPFDVLTGGNFVVYPH